MNAINATEDLLPSCSRFITATVGAANQHSELLEVREYGIAVSYRLGEMLVTCEGNEPLLMSIAPESKIF